MLERAEELKQRIRETPLDERLDNAKRRIGRMCSEGRPPRMTIPVQYDDDDFYISTTLSDAQATIADLQGQVKLANIDQANVEAERNDLQQRVDQLEGELQEYIQAATNEPINEPLTHGALKAARFVAKRAFAELTKLQADYARVLGLVQALPVVPKEYLTDDFVHLGVPVTATLWAQIGPDLIALLTYRASLPAQGSAGKHACDLPGCVSCGNPPDAEGETRA